ncbi:MULTISPECIES: sensor domain-containing protein [Actinosynnema]|uniref:sensor histidine kinase n=1 Tax=Actinosynnema TaxID=40566 RepID=UPI0020A58E8D|nr:sensor domain-containing protein [Actinosynnema pretiosum]
MHPIAVSWRPWLRRAVLHTAIGMAAGAGALLSIVLFISTTYFIVMCLIGIGFVVLPHLTLAVRWLCDLNRRAATRVGVPVERPYLPPPEQVERDIVGWMRRCKWILADPATWRDLLWLLLNCAAGAVAVLPAALLYYVGHGLVLASGLWIVFAEDGSPTWYAFFRVGSWGAAVAAVAVAVVVFVVWLTLSPWIVTGYAHFVRLLLGPTERSRLAHRVLHLAETRSGALDTQAAELRRIERDLHDGVQARLVSLGLQLGVADRHVANNDGEQARQVLREVRASSVQALRELRDLVRGIHPPVLAERGFADAVRALGLASPLAVEVTLDLPGRLPDPVESAVYFSISELLANVLKHSGARRVDIVGGHTGGVFHVVVTDDGRGGAVLTEAGGLGGIRRRLAAFDGILYLDSPPGGPTRTKMEVPCALFSPRTSSS